jgi:hypothetical protein
MSKPVRATDHRARVHVAGPSRQWRPGCFPESVAFSPSGREIAIGVFDIGERGLLLLDAQTLQPLRRQPGGLQAHIQARSLDYSTDGRYLAMTWEDFNPDPLYLGHWVYVWDLAKPAVPVRRIRLSAPSSRPWSPRPIFVPDDRTLLIPAFDGSEYEWDISLDHAVDFACRIVGRSVTQAEWNAVLPNEPYQETCPEG